MAETAQRGRAKNGGNSGSRPSCCCRFLPRISRVVSLLLCLQCLTEPVKRFLVVGFVRLADSEIQGIFQCLAERLLRLCVVLVGERALTPRNVGADED